MPQIYGRLQFGASLNIFWCILWCFFCCECGKIGHFGWPNLGFSTSKSKTCHNHNTQNTTHTTTKMSRRHPTLHRLCHLSPWADYRRHQPIASWLPMVPCKARVVGFGGAMAGSPVWGDEKRRIEKQRDGRGLGLRWPPFNWKIQQSNSIRRMG
jgi:hypothetical protein